jgi:hypothetical protein
LNHNFLQHFFLFLSLAQKPTNITVVFPNVKGSFRANTPINLATPADVATMYVMDFALLQLPTFDAAALKIDPKKSKFKKIN